MKWHHLSTDGSQLKEREGDVTLHQPTNHLVGKPGREEAISSTKSMRTALKYATWSPEREHSGDLLFTKTVTERTNYCWDGKVSQSVPVLVPNEQLFDRLVWNLLQTFIFLKGWSVKMASVAKLTALQSVSHSGFALMCQHVKLRLWTRVNIVPG